MAKQPKFRPSLTAAQIEHILSLCKKESPLSDSSISCISVLAPFKAKIDNEGISAAYVTTREPKEVREAALLTELTGVEVQDPTNVPKEVIWEAAYNKYVASPESCTLEEIKNAQEYRYVHDLMSPEEIERFEQYPLK